MEARIHSGALRPGDRIPFEHELVAHYGCSRATVSKALEALARAGLIERRRKAGSFVAFPHVQSAVLDVPDLAKLIAGRGEAYRWQRLSRGPAGEERLAGSDMATPVVQVEGLHFANEIPFCLETRLISLEAAPAAGTWLLEHMPWTRARHLIRAVEATRPQSALLAIGAGAACLEIERWTWRQDMAVTHVRQLFPGSRYDLTAEFRPGPA